jgi:hypothetical protein
LPTWEVVANLSRWTPEIAFAFADSRIGVEATEFSDSPTTIVLTVEAESGDRARARVRDVLATCDVHLSLADFRGPAPS